MYVHVYSSLMIRKEYTHIRLYSTCSIHEDQHNVMLYDCIIIIAYMTACVCVGHC